ncbi:MAG: hypothetical protein PVH88_00130 [Ignavibacteria bacterium]|jgi:hypothetical protein
MESTGETLYTSASFYTFESGEQSWIPGNTTIDSVNSKSEYSSYLPYEGNGMLVVYPNSSTQLLGDYRSAEVTMDTTIDLTESVLVGAVLTEGAGSNAENYSLAVRLYSASGDSADAITTITKEDWNFFALDVAGWKHADSVKSIWIGCANTDGDSLANWDGRLMLDLIGKKNKLSDFAEVSPIVIKNSSWVATDGLGRTLPDYSEVGSPRSGKYAGVFYYVWHGHHNAAEIYDVSKLLAENPDNPEYGPVGTFHWWGEPEAGYYRADDPWVIRRNLQMLANAGVDFIYLDVSNAFTYLSTINTLCDISLEMRKDGIKTPYIAFLTHTSAGTVVNSLYESFYSKYEYSPLWFIWQGKPLMLADGSDADISSEAKDFFTFRFSWAWTESVQDYWQWIDIYPQDYGWHENADTPEQIPVSVASHPINNIGESCKDGVEPQLDEYKLTEYTAAGVDNLLNNGAGRLRLILQL